MNSLVRIRSVWLCELSVLMADHSPDIVVIQNVYFVCLEFIKIHLDLKEIRFIFAIRNNLEFQSIQIRALGEIMFMRIKRIIFFIITYSSLLLFNAIGNSEDFEEELDFGSYYVPAEFIVHPMSKKFFRGIVNVSTGWGEIPRQIVLTSISDNLPKSLTVGVLKGILMTVVRTGSGVYDTVSFLSSAPGYFDPVLDPPYVWQRSFEDLVSAYQ